MHGPGDNIGFDDDGGRVLVDSSHPVDHFEPLPLPDNQAERDAALAALKWICELIGSRGIVAKVLAVRYLLRIEKDSMAAVGGRYGMSRAAISKHVCAFADQFGLSTYKTDETKRLYSETQKKVWARGRVHCHKTGSFRHLSPAGSNNPPKSADVDAR
jgi:hypothetical protein